MRCPCCRETISNDATICRYCGHDAAEEAKRRFNRKMLLGMTIVGLAAIAGIGFIVLR